jgi:hypothetical protein
MPENKEQCKHLSCSLLNEMFFRDIPTDSYKDKFCYVKGGEGCPYKDKLEATYETLNKIDEMLKICGNSLKKDKNVKKHS